VSIIQEALKKAERHIKDTGQSAPAPSVPQDDAPRSTLSGTSGADPAKKAPAAHGDPKVAAILLVVLAVTTFVAARHLFPAKSVPAAKAAAAVQIARPAPDDDSAAGEKARKPAAVVPKSQEPIILPSLVFQPPEEKKPAAAKFVLNGIMYLEGNPRAIINDSMVEPGDMVDGAKVLKIERRNVVLQYNDSEITIEMK